jgi:hypothetical protein
MGDNILALDLGTTTGWALRENGQVSSGSVSFKPAHFDSGHSRYTRFRRWLGTKGNCAVDEVIFEAVRRQTAQSPPKLWRLHGDPQTWCVQEHSFEGVPVGTIKKFATGNGNAPKSAMVAAMEERGHKPKDDNEADALALLYWRLEQTSLEQTSLEAANRNEWEGAVK